MTEKLRWKDVEEGMIVRWVTPRFSKFGEIITKKGRSLRVRFKGEYEDTVIPDARWYFLQGSWRNNKVERLDILELPPVGQWQAKSLQDWKSSLVIPEIPPDCEREWITPREASTLHGVDQKTLRHWLRSGKVLGKRMTGGWQIDEISLAQAMAER